MVNKPGPVDETTKSSQFEAIVNAYSNDLFRYGLWLTKDAQVSCFRTISDNED